jgi:hypothetical protein
MRRALKYLLPLLAVAVSCAKPATPGRLPVKLVTDIVSGADKGREVIAAAAVPESSGEIFIAGSPSSAAQFKDKFLECDIYENVRGASWSDELKDFAGETFSCISDWAFSPYGELASSPAGTDSLRELAVRLALASLDKKCNVSVYDLDANAKKNPAKIIVLTDPWMNQYGLFDIDTLFTLTSCKVTVISPQDLLFDEVFGGEKKSFNIGLICDSTYCGKGIYEKIFLAKSKSHDIVGTRFFEASADGGSGCLYRFLDAYEAAGNVAPLDAILIDNPDVDMEAFRKDLQAARDYNREEYFNYGKYISPDLNLQNSCELVMRRCYWILRSGSLFTHRIAQPESKNYTVSPRPWAEDMQFLLIPETDDV